MINRKAYRRHDPEFKKETLELVKNSGKSISAIANDLGISSGLLYYWINRESKNNEKADNPENVKHEEARQLRKELEDTKLERDILKKVVAIFSKQPK